MNSRAHIRLSLRILALHFAVISSVACSASQDTQTEPVSSETTLHVARSPWPSFEFLQLGIGKIPRSDQGDSLDLRFHHFTESHSSRRAFEKGSVDVALLTPFEVLLSKAAGYDPVVFMVLGQMSVSVGVATDKSIKSVGELKGKRIGVDVGTLSHFTLIRALQKAGLTVNDVTMVNMGVASMNHALKAGKIQAAATWEPQLSQLAVINSGRIVFALEQRANMIPIVAVSHRRFYHDHPERLIKLARMWFKSHDHFALNKEVSLKLMGGSGGDSSKADAQQLQNVIFVGREKNMRLFNRQDVEQDCPFPKLCASFKVIEDFQREQGLIKQRSQLLDKLFVADITQKAL